MNMDELKGEILSHLAEMSDLTVNVAVERDDYRSGELVSVTTWEIFEDKKKAQESDWISKEATGVRLGEVLLEDTRLYFSPGFNPHQPSGERIFLADLIAPDSFDEAISKLRHALNIANICKPPKGFFGSFPF